MSLVKRQGLEHLQRICDMTGGNDRELIELVGNCMPHPVPCSELICKASLSSSTPIDNMSNTKVLYTKLEADLPSDDIPSDDGLGYGPSINR